MVTPGQSEDAVRCTTSEGNMRANLQKNWQGNSEDEQRLS